MSLQTESVRTKLQEFNFKNLFIEDLGWDHFTNDLSIPKNDTIYTLKAIAHKRGVQTFNCLPDENGNIPDYPVRRQIESEVTKYAREHLIIFTDEAQTTQIWQWVFRKSGEPTKVREYRFDGKHSYEALIQKLENIAFSLNDEEGLTLSGVTVRLKDNFDKDKVTKKFFDVFKKQHTVFLNFIEGVPVEKDRNWYASVYVVKGCETHFSKFKEILFIDITPINLC